MPSRPWAFRSPKKLSLAPPNGKYAIGAATPMLTPTMDALAFLLNSRAARPLLVKIDVALAFGCDCITAIASPSVLTGQIDATGPKISSRPIAMLGDTESKTVGPT